MIYKISVNLFIIQLNGDINKRQKVKIILITYHQILMKSIGYIILIYIDLLI